MAASTRLAASTPTSRSRSAIGRQGTCGDDGLSGDLEHGEPPLDEDPGRPLARASGQPEEVVEVVGHARLRELVEEHGQPPVDPVVGHHANCPPGSGDVSDVSSTPIVRRIARIDRWRRDLAVPNGMPSVRATSGNGIPRK